MVFGIFLSGPFPKVPNYFLYLGSISLSWKACLYFIPKALWSPGHSGWVPEGGGKWTLRELYPSLPYLESWGPTERKYGRALNMRGWVLGWGRMVLLLKDRKEVHSEWIIFPLPIVVIDKIPENLGFYDPIGSPILHIFTSKCQEKQRRYGKNIGFGFRQMSSNPLFSLPNFLILGTLTSCLGPWFACKIKLIIPACPNL